MAEIIHRVGIKASTDKMFRALSRIEGLAGWWTENMKGVFEVGKSIVFQFLISTASSRVNSRWRS